MTTATDARLTAADRALLRAVFAWTRSNGWKREKPTRRKDGTRISATTAWAEIRGSRSVWLGVDDQPSMTMHVQRIADGWLDTWVTSAREAVDILAALGVLPPELSSQWRAGRDAALTGYEWRVMCTADGMRRSYPEPQVWTSNIATEADARLELSVAVSEGAWGEPFIQRRRVGASEWERVTTS